MSKTRITYSYSNCLSLNSI